MKRLFSKHFETLIVLDDVVVLTALAKAANSWCQTSTMLTQMADMCLAFRSSAVNSHQINVTGDYVANDVELSLHNNECC